MTESHEEKRVDTTESNLPRWDKILLPAISLLTISIVILLTEFIARQFYSESRPFIAACMTSIDPDAGGRVAPNSTCWDKKFESDRVEYKFNGCGHRDQANCEVRTPGIYRIVLVGSSVAMGSLVDHDKTIAALLPQKISRESLRSVEVYNEGMVTVHPFVLAQRMQEVLAAKPDLILWVLTPFDIQVESLSHEVAKVPPNANRLTKLEFALKEGIARKRLIESVREVCEQGISKVSQYATETAAGTMVLHFLYQSRSQYLKSYLASGDDAGFLKVKQNVFWSDRIRKFAKDAASIQAIASAAGVPMVTTLIPNRAQAAMISAGDWPQDTNPYRLDSVLHEIISSQAGIYLEISSRLAQIPEAEKYFFSIDGHPNTFGHAMLSTLLAKALASGAVPALTRPAPSAPN